MSQRHRKRPAPDKLLETRKALRAEYTTYELAAKLISSIEAWFRFRWKSTTPSSSTLVSFERFGSFAGMTPDFVARFDPQYILIGEHCYHFRSPATGANDLHQILSYTGIPSVLGASGDVVLFCGTHSEDKARQAIGAETPKRKCNIVVIGYFLDQRGNGEWFDCKWRGNNNDRFSEPNTASPRSGNNLNVLLVDADHHAIPVQPPELAVAARSPFFADTPPAIYTIVVALVPALAKVLSSSEQDDLRIVGKVYKDVTVEQLIATDILQIAGIPRKYLTLALEEATRFGMAKKRVTGNRAVYTVAINRSFFRKDFVDVVIEKAARYKTGQAQVFGSDDDELTTGGQRRLEFYDVG